MINNSLSKNIKFFFTVFANYSYVIVNFLLIAIISNRFSTEILGSYLHSLENYLLRTGSFKKDSLNQAKTIFITLSLPIVCFVVMLGFFNNPLFFYFIPYLLGFTFLTIIIAYNKGRDVNKSFWLNLLIFSVIPLINLCVVHFYKPDVEIIVLLLGFLYFLLALYFFLKELKISINLILDRIYLIECSQYLILTVGSIMATTSSSLIIGFLLNSKITASYIIIEKISDIISLSVTVVAVLSSKPLIDSFNNRSNFKKSYYSFLFKSLILAIVIALLTLLCLNKIMIFLDFEYFDNYIEVVYILFIGKFLICCLGPAILITSISNRRSELIFAYIFIVAFNLIFGSLMISIFGAIGAAVNSVTTLIILRLVFFNKIRKKYFYDNSRSTI